MKKIMFVCHGNICRSPMAEFIMKSIVREAGKEDNYFIVSAATHTDEICSGRGSPIYPPAREQLVKHSIPFGDKHATLLKCSDYNDYDLFVGMDDENIRSINRIFGGDPAYKIHKLLSFSGDDDNVSDPWYTRDFDRAFSDIYRGCAALFKVTDSE